MKRKFWTTKVKTILIAAVVIAIVLTAATAVSNGTPFLNNVVTTLLTPLRSGVAAVDRQAERYYNYLFSYEALQAENESLERQILGMQEQIRDAETYQRENERLRTLLHLAEEHEDYVFVSAYIISWNASNYRSTFTVAKGTNAGLEEGMCAVTENGQVVGLVTEVGANWATVTTILDSSLEISASVASSGYTGVVQGTYLSSGESILRMNYLPTDAVLKNSDQIVTTGSTLYPRGLLLGYLTNVGLDETGVAKYATLDPSCNLDDLEQIFIITEYENQ
ncbi:MAG: rod shape-determining protein MreC [Oscillospiraceae bacterium]|nr:rod shape-determining protein MreC [Oscillospiraceae bacterium]